MGGRAVGGWRRGGRAGERVEHVAGHAPLLQQGVRRLDAGAVQQG